MKNSAFLTSVLGTLLLASHICANAGESLNLAELCKYRADLVASFAVSRDSGISEKKTAADIKKMMKKLNRQAPDMKGYVRLVYANPTVTPTQFHVITESACLRDG